MPVQYPTLTSVLLNFVQAVSGYASLAECSWGWIDVFMLKYITLSIIKQAKSQLTFLPELYTLFLVPRNRL